MVDDAEDLRVAFDRTSEHSGPPVDTGEMMLRVKNRLRHYEGWVNHMYRDVKGYVTVGVGFRLQRSEVGSYSWRSKTTKRSVPPPTATAEWDYVSRLPYGQNIKATRYDEDTQIELSDATIGFALTKKLIRLRADLRKAFNLSGIVFDDLPETVREAIFDLGWNVRGFLEPSTYRKMKDALAVRNWGPAAEESHRALPIPETRNNEIYRLIHSAALEP